MKSGRCVSSRLKSRSYSGPMRPPGDEIVRDLWSFSELLRFTQYKFWRIGTAAFRCVQRCRTWRNSYPGTRVPGYSCETRPWPLTWLRRKNPGTPYTVYPVHHLPPLRFLAAYRENDTPGSRWRDAANGSSVPTRARATFFSLAGLTVSAQIRTFCDRSDNESRWSS
eukprot:1572326-Rhodomonas_salina.1